MSKIQSLKEEIANSLTHGFGILLGFIGVPILVSLAVLKGDTQHIWAVSIYSVSLLMVYVASTLYHSFQHTEVKRVLRVIDHISIYFLIAGSYTPFILIYIEGMMGYLILALIWTIALAGTFFKIFFIGRFNILSVISYLGMGWMALFIGQPIFEGISFEGLIWLIVGGAAYSLGVIFYMWQRLRFSHAIWHLFVLAGSISHYIAIFYSLHNTGLTPL